jgi:NAD(P)-dependent dehydrogenase (short-subunit alcohol dehydrogenase family)
MDLRLDERVVLVTGGSSGIGRAIVHAFADEAARVALTYHSDREAGEATARRVDGLAVPMDLGDPASIDAAVRATVQRWGGIDVLVVNAVNWGTRLPGSGTHFEDVPPAEWQAMLRTNLEGAFATVRAALPAMRGRDWGRIVLMSSGVAEEGLPGSWSYGAAKAGLHGLARSLAWDLGEEGILVNVVGTGFTITERNREWVPQEMRARWESALPSRRLSSPEDVASLVVYLGSAANRNISGEVIREGSSTARSPQALLA